MSQTTTPSNVVPITLQQGRHVGELDHNNSYYEYWASKFRGAQLAKERDRLHRGFAKHRSHRMVLRPIAA